MDAWRSGAAGGRRERISARMTERWLLYFPDDLLHYKSAVRAVNTLSDA
jgi:hypothetical protein